MNIQTITMSKEAALAQFEKYRAAVQERTTAEDRAIMAGYKSLSKGRAIVDLVEVMRKAGLDHKNRPRLAICRADAKDCWLTKHADGGCRFSMESWPRENATRRSIWLPSGTFEENVKVDSYRGIKAKVPYVPSHLRPKAGMSNYHILWEADWHNVPRDPILLRRLGGMLFSVLATWDLTDLEAAVLNNGF